MSDAPVTRPDLEASPLDGKCITCGHAGSQHNDLGYCRTETKRDGQCTCKGGWTVRNERERRREMQAALIAERARADQAEQRIADAWDAGYQEGYDDAIYRYYKTSLNPHRPAPTAGQGS